MSEIVLNAAVREHTGKRAKLVRNDGGIPGVYYARGEEPRLIQVEKLGLDPLIYTSETHVIDLRISDGTARKCILRDVQFDPVSDRPVHFDLQGLKENEKLTIEVPIVLTGGTPVGVRDGGMLQHVIHKLRISCLPKDIPSKIEINVAGLAINQSVHVKELELASVTVLDNGDNTVVAVVPPTLVKEETAAAVPTEEEAKEPEVVGKGKKAEEGEEGAEGAPGKGSEAKPAKEEKKK
jgi:large subunit ribosomal protein L25